MARATPRERLLLAAILLWAAWLRFGFLSARGWWYDEVSAVDSARVALSDVLAFVRAHEGNPPLYFVLNALWARLAGTTEAGLRSLTAAFGVAAVALAYAIGARLVSVRVGLVATALAAANPMLVWSSLDARMYALLVLLGGWSFLAFVRALEEPRGATFAEWTLASALAFYTHYFAVFVVGVEAVWLFLRHARRPATWASLAVLGITGLSVLPHASGHPQPLWMTARSWLMRAGSVPPEFLLGFQPPAPLVLAPIAFATPALALALLWARADVRERRGAATAAVVGGLAIALPALATLLPGLDLLMTRYLSAATLPLLVVLAAGLGARRAGGLGLAAVVATGAFWTWIDLATAHVSKFEHEDWRGAARAMAAADVPRAVVVTPARGFDPMRLYRPALAEAPDGDPTVAEVVVIALPPVFRTLGRPSVPPRGFSPPPPDPAFREVERVETDGFTLVRYRAPGPMRVEHTRLTALALGPEEPGLLLEGPPG